MAEVQKILLGSGSMYITAFTYPTIPADATIETAENLIGLISGGATLEYKPSFVSIKDDSGAIAINRLTAEEVTLKSGVLTFNGDTLAKLSSTARVTVSSTKKTLKVGGLSNAGSTVYLVRFVNIDPVFGTTRVTIAGINQNGLTLPMAKDKETIVDAVFTGQALDSTGTLFQYDETMLDVIPLTVVSVAGNTSGCTAISVSPSLSAGNSYAYKTGSSALTLPALGAAIGSYTPWTYTTEITATTGHYIAIIELDADTKVCKAGQTVVVSKA
jgi:hypothetical protein